MLPQKPLQIGALTDLSPSDDVGISPSEASWLGALDWRRGEWHDAVLDACRVARRELPRIFFEPTVSLPSSVSTMPFPPARQRTNAGVLDRAGRDCVLSADCLVQRPLGDGAAAALGAEALWRQHLWKAESAAQAEVERASAAPTPPIAVTIGSSAAARTIVDVTALQSFLRTHPEGHRFLHDRGLFAYRIDSDRMLVGGALTDGGTLLTWLDSIAPASSSSFDRSRAVHVQHKGSSSPTRPPNADLEGECLWTRPTDIVAMPFWGGERSTGWQPFARGALIGLTHETTRDTIARSLVEGVSFRIARIVAALRELPCVSHDAAVVASGGAVEHSLAWRGILANALGTPVFTATSETPVASPLLDGKVSEACGDSVSRRPQSVIDTTILGVLAELQARMRPLHSHGRRPEQCRGRDHSLINLLSGGSTQLGWTVPAWWSTPPFAQKDDGGHEAVRPRQPSEVSEHHRRIQRAWLDAHRRHEKLYRLFSSHVWPDGEK